MASWHSVSAPDPGLWGEGTWWLACRCLKTEEQGLFSRGMRWRIEGFHRIPCPRTLTPRHWRRQVLLHQVTKQTRLRRVNVRRKQAPCPVFPAWLNGSWSGIPLESAVSDQWQGDCTAISCSLLSSLLVVQKKR